MQTTYSSWLPVGMYQQQSEKGFCVRWPDLAHLPRTINCFLLLLLFSHVFSNVCNFNTSPHGRNRTFDPIIIIIFMN